MMVIYELCKGRRCCPILKKMDDNTYVLEENGTEIYLQPDHLKVLYKIIKDELLKEEKDG